MFQELSKVMVDGEEFRLTIQRAGEAVKVIVQPVLKGNVSADSHGGAARAALAQPLVIKAPAAEVDEKFAEILQGYGALRDEATELGGKTLAAMRSSLTAAEDAKKAAVEKKAATPDKPKAKAKKKVTNVGKEPKKKGPPKPKAKEPPAVPQEDIFASAGTQAGAAPESTETSSAAPATEQEATS